MFDWRYLKEDDYDTLVTWWKWFRFPAPVKEMLPGNGTGGVVVFKDGVLICAGFLYQTNSAFCFLEYIISNPKYRDKDRKEAIEYLIKILSDLGAKLGHKLMFSFVNNENLINRFESAGFIKGSKSFEFIKKI